MPNAEIERPLSRLLAACTALTTIFLVSNSVTDPVNAPKFLVLGILSTSAVSLAIYFYWKNLVKHYRFIFLLTNLFVLFSIISVFLSSSPVSQNLYGVYGRNNGFLTYLFLIFLLFVPLTFASFRSFAIQLYALFFAGLINVGYCLWVILFGDFIGWSNPYGNILGTLGNPNFIGSFLGIFLGAYVAYGTGKGVSRKFKYSLVVVVPITLYEIYNSHAIQGRVIVLMSFGIIGFFHLRSTFSKWIQAIYGALFFSVALLSVLGALQFGVLTQYIYKRSVSLRGQYWLSAWNTGMHHPFSGVGMDGFGDWYRRMRGIKALELPGTNVVVNAAHNVPLDIFAFGGWPLFLSYIALILLTVISIIQTIKKTRKYDGVYVALLTAWIGYQVQSIISINQIGLAVWGWVLSGLLISYSKLKFSTSPNNSNSTSGRRQKAQDSSAKVAVLLLSGGLVGLLLTLPPFLSDSNLRSAQLSQNVDKLRTSLIPGYFNPPSTSKYISAIQMFEDSRFYDLSHMYAKEAVIWNPENYELWRVLYFIKGSSNLDRKLAIQNMIRLDPLNPDVTKP